MKIELQKQLENKYPTLFQILDGNTSGVVIPLAFGFECGGGWYKILDELFAEMAKDKTVRVGQVKEKFGGLRVYVCPMKTDNFFVKKIFDLIDKAEAKAWKTCEFCGARGRPRKASWVKTLCNKCADKHYHREG